MTLDEVNRTIEKVRLKHRTANMLYHDVYAEMMAARDEKEKCHKRLTELIDLRTAILVVEESA